MSLMQDRRQSHLDSASILPVLEKGERCVLGSMFSYQNNHCLCSVQLRLNYDKMVYVEAAES